MYTNSYIHIKEKDNSYIIYDFFICCLFNDADSRFDYIQSGPKVS
jgi:hypothetical protein